MLKTTIKLSIMAVSTCLLLVACSRGRNTTETPIHPNPNMDKMEKFKAQDKSPFFEDGRTMRQPVSGTVARGWLLEDSDTDIYVRRYNYSVPVEQAFTYYTGGVEEGKTELVNNKKQLVFTDKSPIPATVEFIYRGKERFEIYCSACHGFSGEGNGIITKHSQMKPRNLHEIRDYKLGNIFDVISNGRNTMKGYRHQIPVEDRWAIATYVKVLQESRSESKK